MKGHGERIRELENKIIQFCSTHNRIFLYGAGNYGKTYLKFLENINFNIAGFISTEGGEDVLGIPVYKAGDIIPLLGHDDGVILSVKEAFQQEILCVNFFKCDVMANRDVEQRYLETLTQMHLVYAMHEKYSLKNKIEDYHWKNVLIVQVELTYGDMIWSTAFLRELRRNYPKAHITYVMNAKFTKLYNNCPYIDEIFTYEDDLLLSDITEEMCNRVEKFAKMNLKREYDVVFLPRLLPLSARDSWENILIAIASGARYRIAHALNVTESEKYICEVLEDLFSIIVKHNVVEHEVKHDLSMLEAINGKIDKDNMELWPSEMDEVWAERVLMNSENRKFIIAVALVGSQQSRSWDPIKYGGVLKKIIEKYGTSVLFVLCGGKDAVDAAKVVQQKTDNRCIDITGKTSLPQVAALIKKSSLYIGSDTGLLHMASAFGVPIIEISASSEDSPTYWGSSPTRTGPWRVPSIVLRPRKSLDGCKYMCSKKYAHCINQISEDEVEAAVCEMLGE